MWYMFQKIIWQCFTLQARSSQKVPNWRITHISWYHGIITTAEIPWCWHTSGSETSACLWVNITWYHLPVVKRVILPLSSQITCMKLHLPEHHLARALQPWKHGISNFIRVSSTYLVTTAKERDNPWNKNCYFPVTFVGDGNLIYFLRCARSLLVQNHRLLEKQGCRCRAFHVELISWQPT